MMIVEPVHVVNMQSTVSGTQYTLAEVEKQIQRISDRRTSYEQLRQTIVADEKMLQEMVANLELPPGDERTQIFRLYWTAQEFVKVPTLRSLAERVLGIKDAAQWRKLIAGKTILRCSVCGEEREGNVASRQALLDTHHLCSMCEKKQQDEQRKWKVTCTAQAQERHLQIEELRIMPYVEYLKTDWWKQVRAGALQRAKYRCQLCGAEGKPLEVHHNNYERRGCERNSDVVVLCGDCHEKHHDKGGER